MQDTATDSTGRNPRATEFELLDQEAVMNFGGVSGNEQKITIRLDRETKQAYIACTWPEWIRKCEMFHRPPSQVSKTQDGCASYASWRDA